MPQTPNVIFIILLVDGGVALDREILEIKEVLFQKKRSRRKKRRTNEKWLLDASQHGCGLVICT